MFIKFLLYPCLFKFRLLPFSIRITCTNQHNILRNRLPLESTVNYHFFNITQLISGVKLVKENPYFLPCNIFNLIGSLKYCFVVLGKSLFVNSCMNVEDYEFMLKYGLYEESYQGSLTNTRFTHNDDGDM